MKIHLQTRCVLFIVSMAGVALLTFSGAPGCHAQQPAATPAAEEPAEPQVPIMLRTFQEMREYKGSDGELVPIEENKRIRQPVMAMLSAGKFSNPDDQKVFDDFYRWRIAELTWAENLPKLAEKRTKFKKQDLNTSGRQADQAVHDRLNAMLLKELQSIARSEDYHPAIRCNCVLLIGVLDQREATDNNGAGVIPLPEALPVLVNMAKDREGETELKLPDCVRISALLGVARHSEHEMASAVRKETVIPLYVGIVGSRQPIGAGTIGGNGWLRRRGAEALGTVAIKWPEANAPQVAGALLSLVSDEEASLVSRSEAAKSIGAIEKSALGNAAALAQAFGGVAVAIAKRGPVPETAKLGTDYLSYLYLGLLSGLKGFEPNRGLVAAAGDSETKAFIGELTKKVEEMLSVTTDPKMQEPTRIERLDTLGDRLDEWLKKAGPKPAGAS